MERPIKGGYILISLGLVALQIGASLTIDYERITKTKKHIVLTGIKVGSEVMPDIAVEPIIGSGKVTFKGVYGFDLEVASNGSVTISKSEETPNVEEAPSGEIVDALGLDEDGKVVKGSIPNVEKAESGTPVSMLGLDEDGEVVKSAIPSGGTKLYKHVVVDNNNGSGIEFISPISTPLSSDSLQSIFDTGIKIRKTNGTSFENMYDILDRQYSNVYYILSLNNIVIDSNTFTLLEKVPKDFSEVLAHSLTDTVTEL